MAQWPQVAAWTFHPQGRKARVATDARGCVGRLPVASRVFITVSLFSAEREARTSAKKETRKGHPEGVRRKDKV